MRHGGSLAVLVLALLSATPAAQRVVPATNDARHSTELTIAADDQAPLAWLSIQYGAPQWREGYAAAFDALGGSNYTRLGVGAWTSLSSIGALEIGGVEIPAGSYFLGLRVREPGALDLLVFDAKVAMQQRWLPQSTALYTGDARPQFAAPMTITRLPPDDLAPRLTIEVAAEMKEVAQGSLTIRWGPIRAQAPLRIRTESEPKEAGTQPQAQKR